MQDNPLIVARAVDWFEVHRLVAPVLDGVESWPLAGTLAWQWLADTDPAKWAAVLDLGRHFALRLDTEQRALADASREISAGARWDTLARRIRYRPGSAYVPRRAS